MNNNKDSVQNKIVQDGYRFKNLSSNKNGLSSTKMHLLNNSSNLMNSLKRKIENTLSRKNNHYQFVSNKGQSSSNNKKVQWSSSKIYKSIQRSFQQSWKEQHEYVMVLVCNWGFGVGFAAFSLVSGEIQLGQINDNQQWQSTHSLFVRLSPQIVFISHSQEHSFFVQKIKEKLPNIKIECIENFQFNENKGYELLQRSQTKINIASLDNNYLSLQCLAVLDHVINRDQENRMEIENTNIVFYQQNDTMKIDPWLLFDMRVISNDKENKQSLFDQFQFRTYSGKNLFRNILISPYKKIEEILIAQQTNKNLMENISFQETLKQTLVDFKCSDIITLRLMDKVQNSSIAQIQKGFQLLQDIKQYIDKVILFTEQIQNKLSHQQQQLLGCLDLVNENTIKTLKECKEEIQSSFNIEIENKQNNQNDLFIFFLKSDIDMFVDLSRCSYSWIYEQIMELFENYQKQMIFKGVSGLKLKYNKQRRYHLKLFGYKNEQKFNRIIQDSIQEQPIYCDEKQQEICFTTASLHVLNEKITNCVKEILSGTFQYIQNILHILRQNLQLFFKVNSIIAKLDATLSIVEMNQKYGFKTQPIIMNEEIQFVYLSQSQNHQSFIKSFFEGEILFSSLQSNWFIKAKTQQQKEDFQKEVLYMIIMTQLGSCVQYECCIMTSFSSIQGKFQLGSSTMNQHETSGLVKELLIIEWMLMQLNDQEEKSLLLVNNIFEGTSSDERIELLIRLGKVLNNKAEYIFLCSFMDDVQIDLFKDLYLQRVVQSQNTLSFMNDEFQNIFNSNMQQTNHQINIQQASLVDQQELEEVLKQFLNKFSKNQLEEKDVQYYRQQLQTINTQKQTVNNQYE